MRSASPSRSGFEDHRFGTMGVAGGAAINVQTGASVPLRKAIRTTSRTCHWRRLLGPQLLESEQVGAHQAAVILEWHAQMLRSSLIQPTPGASGQASIGASRVPMNGPWASSRGAAPSLVSLASTSPMDY